MGYYTEFKFKARIKKDSTEVIELLDRIIHNPSSIWEQQVGYKQPMMYNAGDTPNLPIEHEFGKCDRWEMLFHSNNFDSKHIKGSSFNKETGELIIHTEFKNYGNEIELFVDWITPHIVGRKKKQYLGSWRNEDMNDEVNIYIER